VVKCAYLLIGAGLFPVLTTSLFGADGSRHAMSNPIAAFVTIVGTIALWPLLLLLIVALDK
jgi:hypothetical protein